MKFLADENIDQPIIEHLRKENHHVLSIYETNRGIDDDIVLEITNSENAILLTSDKDFGEIIFRKKMISTGVVLLRLAGLSNNEKAHIVASVLEKHQDEVHNSFTVITSETIRIRKLNL